MRKKERHTTRATICVGARTKHSRVLDFWGAARFPPASAAPSLPCTMLTSTLRRLAPSLAASLRPTPLSASAARAGVTSSAVRAHGGGDGDDDKGKET